MQVYSGLVGSELAGEFFLHTKMSDSQRQALIDGHQLFRGKDRMQAASGYHESSKFCPIFVSLYPGSNDLRFLLWV